MIEQLNGKKTYIVAAAFVLYSILKIVFGDATLNDELPIILNGLGLAAIRDGISKM